MSEIKIEDEIVMNGEEQIATFEKGEPPIVYSEAPLTPVLKGQINKAVGVKCDFQLNSGVDDDDTPEDEAKSSGDEPEKDPMIGDLTPAYIEWHKKNKSASENEARYGKGFSRLDSGNHIFPNSDPKLKL